MADIGIKISATDAASGVFKTVASEAGRLQGSISAVSGVLSSLGVGLSAGAFLAFVTNINNGVDALNDLKDATGASIENISALEDVARRTGSSFDTVSTALIKLNQGLSAAKPGSDTERAIKAIGLSVAELKTLDPAEAFRRIAVSLSGFEDDANKARLTQELFGKSLKEVAPLLKDLAEQGQLNATVTTAQAEAAEKLNKQIFNLQKNAIDAGRAITGALVPALSDGVDRFLLAQKHAGGLLDTLALYARLDYSKGIQGNLGQVEAQIAALEQRAGRITSAGAQRGNDKMIADLRAQAAYLKELRQIKILEDQGDVGDAVSRKFLNRKASVGDVLAGDGGKAAGAAAAKALQDQNRELAEQANLLATLSGVNGDYQEQLTRLQVVRKSQNLSDARYSELVTELIDKQPMVRALYAEQEKSAKAWEDQAKASARAVAELSKDYDAYVKTLDASAVAVGNQVQKLQDEELATEIAAAQNISLAQAIEQVTIARLSEAQTKAYANGDKEAGDAIKREIEARKKLATLIGGKEVREANKKAADDAAKEWEKTADKMSDSITDALMRGFESGKGFAENLRDTIENIFKTMVLRPVVQATVNTGLQALGIPGVGGSSGGAGGLLDSASNAYSLYNKASSLFGGSTSSAFGFAGLAGAGTAAGASAALPAITATAIEAGITAGGASIYALGSAAGAAGATIPVLGGTLGAGGLVASAPVVAAPLAAAPAAAAIPGIGWAIGGALLLAGLLSGDNGPKLASTGDAIRRYDKGGALTENGNNDAWFFTNTADANKLLDGLESRYQKAAKALGIGTVATQFDYGSNNRGNFALAGAAGNSRANTGEIAYSAEAMQVAASRAVFAALQGSELPKYLSGLLDSVGDINALSQAQIDDVLNTAQAFKGLHDVMVQMPFEALHDLSYNAAKGLVEFSGGLDKLTQNLGTYYDNFYNAEEKKAQTLANITRTLTDAGALTRTTRTAIAGEFDVRVGAQGDTSLEQRYATSIENLDMPKTREEFRALVESMRDLGGEAAQKAYAALLSVSGAFASVTPAANDAAAAVEKAAADAATALEKDLAARTSWQQKLDLLTGKTTERALSLQSDLAGTTDAATQALIRQVYAQEDAATAAQATADAMATAADALRNALQSSLDASRSGVANAVAAIRTSVDAQKAAVTDAYTLQADAIRASLDTVGGSINKLRSLSGNLKSTLDSMRIVGGDLGYRQAAQAQITAALATARAGGGLPVNGQLDSALRTVSQSSDELFGSFAEYAFDFYKTANDIAALSDITGTQLTGEELTQSLLKTQADNLKTGFDAELKRLDALVDAAQAQADAATKSTVALQSMADAIARFTDSLGVTLTNSLATAFDTFDTDSSNGVGWGEFSAAFGTLASEATLKALFDKTDLNGNGTISQLEAINANTANLLANMRVTGAGGNLAGAATYTGTQVVAEASKLLTAGATTASVINTASTGYGVSSGSLAAVAATLPKDPVAQAFIDYQNRVAAHAALSAQERSDVMAEAGRRAGASGESVEKELYKWALSLGWNAGMVDKAMGWANGTSNGWATANGYPAFAQGINYLPHDTMAMLHEGEAVVPKVYNPFNPNAAGAGNARLESLVAGLTAEVQRLQAIVNDGNRHQQRTADAVNGNPEAPMLVETV